MAYNSGSRTMSGTATASDIVNLVNDEIPKWFDGRVTYWRNNRPAHWPAAWANKLAATNTLPRMSIPGNMGRGNTANYATFLASLDQMFRIWSMFRNITYNHTVSNGFTNGGAATSTHRDGAASAFLTENSYSISGRDRGYELSGRALQTSSVRSLLGKLRSDIWNAGSITYSYADPCHSNCHNNCHSNCHGSGGFR